MKALPALAMLLVLTSGCGKSRAELEREAREREIARQVELRADKEAERRLASTRMIVLGSIAVTGLLILCTSSGQVPEPAQPAIRSVSTPPRDLPQQPTRRRDRRIIDIGP